MKTKKLTPRNAAPVQREIPLPSLVMAMRSPPFLG